MLENIKNIALNIFGLFQIKQITYLWQTEANYLTFNSNIFLEFYDQIQKYNVQMVRYNNFFLYLDSEAKFYIENHPYCAFLSTRHNFEKVTN
jgi:hypothetical protein